MQSEAALSELTLMVSGLCKVKQALDRALRWLNAIVAQVQGPNV